jgi:hypothetical protein
LKTKKIAILFLLILSSSISLTFLNKTLAQTSDIQRQKAQTLISILINNNSTITTTLHNLDSQSIQFSEAQTRYNEGLFYFTQATNLFNEEKFSEACNEAVVATQKFKETLQLIENSGTIESVESEILAQEIINLKANISRTLEHVARLENLTQKAAKAGYDTVALDKKILEVKQYLENAIGELRNSNLKGATEQLSIARTYLAEFDDYLKRLTNSITATNIANYLNAAETRLSEIKKNITLSTTLTAVSKETAIIALNNSEVNLANARDKIEENNVKEAIENLEEAKIWEEESSRTLTSDSLNTQSALPTVSASKTNENVSRIDTATLN